MTISLIVAVTDNDVIGKENAIPWYLPADLAHFKQTTIGHPIIMGRKTHESIGRALPERLNVVITRNPAYKAAEACVVVNSLDEALNLDEIKNNTEVLVIGGAEIYKQALPLADRIYLTRVHTTLAGDKFFKFNPEQWRQISKEKHTKDEKNQYDYEFILLEHKK